MADTKIKQRNEIPEEFKWALDTMYSDSAEWDADLKKVTEMSEAFLSFKGRLGESAGTLLEALRSSDDIGLIVEKLFVFARMKLDEDNRVPEQQAMFDRIIAAASDISARLSFFTPELIELSVETITNFMKEEPGLDLYDHVLKDAMRQKEHVLSDTEEHLLAELGEVLGAPDTVFTMLNDADMKFGEIEDESGNTVALTHGNYIKYMRSYDRKVRESAYNRCYETYKGLINTLAANYNTNVKTDVITARIRKYPSSRSAAMSGGNIPESVYYSLVESVNGCLDTLHEYTALRKKLLGVDELKMHDIYVPLIKVPDEKIPFEKAVEIAVQGLAPLGEEYIAQFLKGIDEHWIDRYENEGKTSGAYSFGSYDSAPFILLNYDDTLEDVFTLVHEMGHSMNSFYTRKEQPFTYGDYSIFTAEVASTVNETLLMKYLLSTEKDPDKRKYILNMYLEAFRATLFRQTMFAEFEHLTHREVESGGSLTAEWLCEEYDKLNTKYFGPALAKDDMIKYEWARIPHFYRSFYVYQYATGYSAANAIANRILSEGEPAVRDYIRFLGTGSSDYPVKLLKIAGVDMSTTGPVDSAMNTFRELFNEFKELCDE